MGSTFRTTRFIYSKVSASTLSDEVVQDEEEVESSSQSIRIEESLLGVTPSPAAPEVYEISDISTPHMADPKEDIRISVVEENLSFHSMQKFSSDSSIINYVHSLPVVSAGKGEEFDFSVSNDVAGVKISNYLDILEIISDYRIIPNTLIYLELPTNSYMIACTNIHNFEEGENCASTILVEQTLGSDMKFIRYDMILFGSDLILLGSIF